MATNAKETAKQENGSKAFFESVIEKNKEPSDKEMIKIYDSYDYEWKETYRKQVKGLKTYIKSQKGYEYSRDEGIMPMIEDLAKTEGGVSVKDRWNPMDIVMVKRNKKKFVINRLEEVKSLTIGKKEKLIFINNLMKDFLEKKILIGISLKAIAKKKQEANVELANMEKSSSSSRTTINLVKNSIKCNLTLGKKKNFLFDTGELGFDLISESGAQIHGQSRNFQYSNARNLVQTDLTPKGKDAGAKLGKVSSKALDEFLNSIGLERPPSASKHPHIPAVGAWTDKDKKYWMNLYNSMKNNNMIDFGEVAVYKNSKKIGSTFKDVLENAIIFETNNADRSSAGRFSSKLIAMEWANIWIKISKKRKMKEWCTVLYYGAKKEFDETNGPFLKIY